MAKGGRPTKYEPEMCDRVVDLGRDGYTLTEIAAELDVARQTLYNWQDEHPEFLDAVTRATDLAEAWWSKEGRKGIWSRDFNASAYRLQMMNRFGWGEKSSQDIKVEGGVLMVPSPVTDDEWSSAASRQQNGDSDGES